MMMTDKVFEKVFIIVIPTVVYNWRVLTQVCRYGLWGYNNNNNDINNNNINNDNNNNNNDNINNDNDNNNNNK